ncbi:peptide-methionine (S)-S-oxide reductase MsrA [Oligoflexia bacterium]|nr:peptide-methionine (S)-S-oxide reductase MsrA [Oligoflexia bacterium]
MTHQHTNLGHLELATFGAGCFWGVEETFRRIAGVIDTEVGYAGGYYADPTYADVCGGATGHAEVVQVQFDALQVSYTELLTAFWNLHDPTTLNRQGPNVGTQYRSVIFCHKQEQEVAAKLSKAQLDKAGGYKRPIVTEIKPNPPFYRAEDYHQQYESKHGQSSCGIRI